ncbi:Rv3654c family TadE-like protein [Agromyces sp. G08B096]|uniref:Rv3654c family TadE-like protein n=1 Tax=Agromyces sp. G08B096 TaxID=3156399 RepID=A0AAU7W4Q8_9MICO
MRRRGRRMMGVGAAVRVSERGAGSVLALALVGAVVAVTLGLVPVLAVFVESQRAANAADAAALAAADAVSGAVAGEPCALAATVAARNGARLTGCTGGDDGEATVAVVVEALVFEVTARARAGPAPAPRRRARARGTPWPRLSRRRSR